MSLVIQTSIHIFSALTGMLKIALYLVCRYNDLKKRLMRKKESAQPMKKSCLIAVVAALAAVAGALVAVAVYLRRREKELDEYESLLYSDSDFDEDDDEDEETVYEPIDTEPKAETDDSSNA